MGASRVTKAARSPLTGEGVAAARTTLDAHRLRADFAYLEQLVNGKPLAFLDSAASTQKPVFEALNSNIDTTRANLATALDYAANAYEAYAGAVPRVRRELNQFFFTRPSSKTTTASRQNSTSPTPSCSVPTFIKAVTRHATTAHAATPRVARTTSGTNKPRRPSGRRGLNYELMVGGAGLEPATLCV